MALSSTLPAGFPSLLAFASLINGSKVSSKCGSRSKAFLKSLSASASRPKKNRAILLLA